MRHRWVIFGLVLLVLALTGNHLVAAKTGPVVESEASVGAQGNPLATAVQTDQSEQPKVIRHVVESGETLGGIAVKYGTDVSSIMASNNLSSANRLKVGQELKVLTVKGLLHRVSSGDTLWDIARKYSVKVEDIQNANSAVKEGPLTLGKELIIPGGKLPARSTPVSRGTGRGSSSSSASTSSLGMRWPLRGPITSGFGTRWGKLHAAIDIGVSTGTPVKAAAAGRVTYSGWADGYGKLVIIRHSNGIETRYGHNSKLSVSVGQYVEQGTTVALSGNTGFSTGPHLHFEVRKNGKPENPLKYLP